MAFTACSFSERQTVMKQDMQANERTMIRV